MDELRSGLEHGLTIEQVRIYANPKFSAGQSDAQDNQMREIRLGLEHNLPLEQVRLYADQKIDCKQMQKIRTGFENGVTVEQMKQVLGIAEQEKPSVSEKLDSMDHTPCTTTNNKNRNETVK